MLSNLWPDFFWNHTMGYISDYIKSIKNPKYRKKIATETYRFLKRKKVKKPYKYKKQNKNIRFSKEYRRLWKRTISRANGICELCCRPSNKLIMHHIEMVKDAPKRILDEKNVIAICEICHKEIHPWLR
jgi:hypothetical protein